ncbi:transcriptional regulator LytR [Halobacillus andaensis]|uniref:Transcriptional regulator LytR n=1 Tax=Halobacillus andaensis TaxID=1176239 RepID=A0A917B9H3_HALAA|nr:LCP family protein [Halobacillus andaensis]MBP2005333.1 LCP family protein required for cell wall assembly [Halobacillus andaensis]GGF30638.1 transcriptional regulator LytR [Halobacillus andaensis]
MEKRRNKHSRKKKKKLLWITLSIILLIGVGVSAYLYSIYNNVKTTVDNDIHETVTGIDHEATKKKVDDQDPINILLLGVDERDNDKGRSDTMIVMTLDPAQERMQMVSIPRDTRTEIVGRDMEDKINHAYAFGGSEMSVNTVESFLDIELDYYLRMNMEGLGQLVDAVGGITVTNEFAFEYGGKDFSEGEIELNGEEALAWVRMRYDDPQGDAGRNERQRQVIQGVIDRGANINAVNKIGDIMDVLGNNVATNMKFEDMRNLVTNYRGARKDVSSYQMSGDGTTIDNIYYLQVPESEVEKTNEMIQDFSS